MYFIGVVERDLLDFKVQCNYSISQYVKLLYSVRNDLISIITYSISIYQFFCEIMHFINEMENKFYELLN